MSRPPRLSRRDFLSGTVAMCCLLGGCTDDEAARPRAKLRLADLSAVQPGITPFAVERIALVRDDGGIGAVSMVCTHQTCLLRLGGRQTLFDCPCHGSKFDTRGHPVTGPAVRPLPWYRISIDAELGVWVNPGEIVTPEWRLRV